MGKKVITSECVSYGHPDKVADQVSDAILDAILEQDANARVGVEVLIKDNVIVLGGEVKTTATVNYDEVARRVVDGIGYPSDHHLSKNELKVINLIGVQSPEISNGVDGCQCGDAIGAGDQGFVVGFASNETETYMPLGHYLAKKICGWCAKMDGYGPDAKAQVVVEYDGKKTKVNLVLVSIMSQYDVETVRNTIKDVILSNKCGIDNDIFHRYIDGKDITIDINPCGEWRVGGPVSDCGVTGRKIVVDQYGGYCKVGGGNLGGKDYSKVDRSGAYMCRYLAKNIVASGLCSAATVELSYEISKAEPCAFNIELENPIDLSIKNVEYYIKKWINEHISLTPSGIMNRFDGSKPRNEQLSRNGHFGFNNNDEIYPWEKIDFAEDLMKYIKELQQIIDR